jgi:hypothetical protein
VKGSCLQTVLFGREDIDLLQMAESSEPEEELQGRFKSCSWAEMGDPGTTREWSRASP